MSKITRTMLEGLIARVYYINGREAAADFCCSHDNPIPPADSRIGLMTIALVELKTGFVITGQSACIDPANYDAAEGRKWALEDAIGKLWDLHGYHVVAMQAQRQPRVFAPQDESHRSYDRMSDAALNEAAGNGDTDASIEMDIRRELARG
ncbi:Gp49 family protein [Pseudescherichia sp.]|uniref:Gp49 family protein n=1 Tax=Pseudescherichia sp. TaxID=2055881 RepID=UPI0028AC49FD|nr:Gp49 family protein [Pseudescherichia sp.]